MRGLIAIWVIVLFIISFPRTVFADDKDFPYSGTINQGEVWDNVWIYDTPPSFTTVNMLGGQVGSLDIATYSTLNVDWGMIGNLNARDTSFVTINDGIINQLSSSGNSRITTYGGDFQNVSINESSRLRFYDGYIQNLNVFTNRATYISGGQIDNIYAYGWGNYQQVFNISGGTINSISSDGSWNSKIFNISGGQTNLYSNSGYSACYGNNVFNISGGEVWGLQGRDNMTINVTGGKIGDYIDIGGQSILNVSVGNYSAINGFMEGQIRISGGTYNDIHLNDNSLLQLRNGSINSLTAGGDSYAILEGGIIYELLVKDFAAVELYEGAIVSHILARDDGIIKIYGYDFVYDENGGSYGGGRLLGFWLDGHSLMIDFANALNDSTYYNHVLLIPEPVSIMLLSLGALFLRKRSS